MYQFFACENPRALEYMSSPMICTRCGAAQIDLPPAEVAITTGETWSVNTRRLTLCRDCEASLDAWLCSAHQTSLDGPGGALASTAIADGIDSCEFV